MFKILKYLKESKAAVVVIVLLLILQAYCDLSLPSYTSDIVDVGIGQNGIENAVLDVMREETLESICLFSEEKDETLIRESYVLNEDGDYELVVIEEETINALDEAMEIPMVMVYMLENADSSQMSEGSLQGQGTSNMAMMPMDMESLKAMVASGMMTKDQILSIPRTDVRRIPVKN